MKTNTEYSWNRNQDIFNEEEINQMLDMLDDSHDSLVNARTWSDNTEISKLWKLA